MRQQLLRIAKEFGTPCYVYFADRLDLQASKLKAAVPAGWKIYYAMKANPHPEIVQAFRRHGFGIEIASGGELAAALAAGVPAREIVFAGPGKTDKELAAALAAGIHMLHAESFGELQRIDGIAHRLGKIAGVALRVNPLHTPGQAGLQMGGASRQFGIDAEQLTADKLAGLEQFDHVEVKGVHVYAASQVLDKSEFLAHARQAFASAGRLANHVGLEYVNIGGGIGIPYAKSEQEFDTAGLASALDTISKGQALGDAQVCLESGRYLAGPAGFFLAQVVDTKTSRGKNYAILDGGMNCFLRPALTKTAHPSFNLLERGPAETILTGPLCTPLDVLGTLDTIALPGDTIAFGQAGAYGFTESMPLFLSHDLPCEVLVEHGPARVITARRPGHGFAQPLP
ncbi:MAG: hypothetical protein HY519_01535 [Candidatus Aenigmarchaeota archaeon]|nr:hypothetical protein [Candidatus Aenigmarchaeota archaeon]